MQALVNAATPGARAVLLRIVDLAMALTALFMLVWGAQLVRTTWHQVIAEFPVLSVGVTYLPLPIAGALTLLFILERAWVGEPPPTSVMYRDPAGALE